MEAGASCSCSWATSLYIAPPAQQMAGDNNAAINNLRTPADPSSDSGTPDGLTLLAGVAHQVQADQSDGTLNDRSTSSAQQQADAAAWQPDPSAMHPASAAWQADPAAWHAVAAAWHADPAAWKDEVAAWQAAAAALQAEQDNHAALHAAAATWQGGPTTLQAAAAAWHSAPAALQAAADALQVAAAAWKAAPAVPRADPDAGPAASVAQRAVPGVPQASALGYGGNNSMGGNNNMGDDGSERLVFTLGRIAVDPKLTAVDRAILFMSFASNAHHK